MRMRFLGESGYVISPYITELDLGLTGTRDGRDGEPGKRATDTGPPTPLATPTLGPRSRICQTRLPLVQRVFPRKRVVVKTISTSKYGKRIDLISSNTTQSKLNSNSKNSSNIYSNSNSSCSSSSNSNSNINSNSSCNSNE